MMRQTALSDADKEEGGGAQPDKSSARDPLVSAAPGHVAARLKAEVSPQQPGTQG